MRLTPGYATPEATRDYARRHAELPEGHFSEFNKTRIRLSSLGVGTFPGEAGPETDRAVADIVAHALEHGINVVDTAAHYRYGRALAAVGTGLRAARVAGVPREAIFLVSKGGFITWHEGRPQDPEDWIRQRIVREGLAEVDDIAQGVHCLSPDYIDYQLELSRRLMGVETLDAFLVDQPEIHFPRIGKEATYQRLQAIYERLERAIQEGRLRWYGLSTFDALRVATDDPRFISLTSQLGLAEKAAQAVAGEGARHHFALVQMPFNLAMTEGFTRFNQATGQGNIASTLQAAYQLRIYVMGSHTLGKGRLAQLPTPPALQDLTPTLANPAQRALQFARSTPGLGTALTGLSQTQHLKDLLTVATHPPLPTKTYLTLYQRT